MIHNYPIYATVEGGGGGMVHVSQKHSQYPAAELRIHIMAKRNPLAKFLGHYMKVPVLYLTLFLGGGGRGGGGGAYVLPALEYCRIK